MGKRLVKPKCELCGGSHSTIWHGLHVGHTLPEQVSDERAIALAQSIIDGVHSVEDAACEIMQYATDAVLQMQTRPSPEPVALDLDAVREALEPFAKVADLYSEMEDSDYTAIAFDADLEPIKSLTLGQCRRARAILAILPAPEKKG